MNRLKTLALVCGMSVGMVAAPQTFAGDEEPPEEPPLEHECSRNTVSRPGIPWTDVFGKSGRAVATFDHVGCRDPFCTRPRSVWPLFFNGFGGKWIWKNQVISVAEAESGDLVSFFDTFCRPRGCGSVTSVNLLISADNDYVVHYVDASGYRNPAGLAGDSEWRTVEGVELPAPEDPEALCQRFEIEVQNFPMPGGDGNVNPAGVNYDLRVTYEREEPAP